MKATLEFNLPEERTEHLWAVKAPEMASSINYFFDTTRGWVKYGHDFKDPNEAINACRDLLAEIMNVVRGEE
jgi:hypothetical protein